MTRAMSERVRDSDLMRELDAFLGGMGFELVSLDRGGGRRPGSLRLKIDRPGGEPGGSSVTVGDCTRVARELRDHFEGRPDVPTDVALEVSSPGVERPLVRPRDYRRFVGREVRLKGYGPLVPGRKTLEGVLREFREPESEDEDAVVVVVVDGEELEVTLPSIASGRLVYRWEDDL